jgi:phosphatidylinositol 3-kinase
MSEDLYSKVHTTAFGLSKDLKVPIYVKICYLKATNEIDLTKLSRKYENPEVFKVLSNIYRNSDLYVETSIFNGQNNNLLTIPVQTHYKPFNNSNRIWNKHLNFPINYNQIDINSYIKFSIYEICDTKPKLFGIGYLSLFNLKNSCLRKGSQKIAIYTNEAIEKIDYYDIPGLSNLEKNLISYENGEYPRLQWLDKLVLPQLDKLGDIIRDHDYYLYVELPNFELPIVYSDVTYNLVNFTTNIEKLPIINDVLNSSLIINSIDIPMNKSSKALKIYDPDFQFSINQNLPLDPIELKYHRLERNINNNIILDKDIKPTPQLRDELLRILHKPSNIELNDIEKNLIWKFRYYFSKSNADPNSISNHGFLPKFLKSINWDDDHELDLVFNEIIPNYWSVDRIQIGDALELLSNFFNPYTLCSSGIPTNFDENQDQIKKNEEAKFNKIFKYVTFIRKFAVDRLALASIDELLLYLLQLVQALKYEALIYENPLLNPDSNDNFQILNEINESKDRSLLHSPLSKLLIEKSTENQSFGTYFYWYLKVENEDQLNIARQRRTSPIKIYSIIINKYIDELKKYSKSKKVPYYQHLKQQIWFIKKLTSVVDLLRTTFKKNEATSKKKEFLREYLANSSNELLKFEPFPLPLDPSVMICGCYPNESFVFKSSLAPLKITFKTIEYRQQSTSQLLKKNYKYGKYLLMFKIGDDLRQDQFVIQIINLMDQLLKSVNLDLRLTPYKILATSPIAGLIQFVPNETLDSILSQTYPGDDYPIKSSTNPNGVTPNGILSYLRLHSKETQVEEPIAKSIWKAPGQSQAQHPPPTPIFTSDLGVSSKIMDNYVKSCAGYCVITYLLGVGDRHLDNLLLSPNGKFWHADFGYILGRDPKPFPPLMKLPIQVVDGMGGLTHENFNIFKGFCFVTYSTLRKNSNLILNLFELMVEANIPDIKIDPHRTIEKVQEKFCLDMTEEEAILHFQNLINDSVNAFLPVVIDRLHSLAQYWRA